MATEPRLSLALLVAGGALILTANDAAAFCRTTTCDSAVESCVPPAGKDCIEAGLPLYWPGRCVSYSLNPTVPPNINLDDFTAIARDSFLSWFQIDCGAGSPPALEFFTKGPVECATTEYNQDSGNANIIAFRIDDWPYAESANTLALTTVTFNTETGEIYDVDMELNAAQVRITAGDDDIDYDLQSILTHEIGHFVGLSHSPATDSTMFPRYKRGTTELRSLSEDDQAGVCAVYPPGSTDVPCDPVPRHGFQSTCGNQRPKDDEGCSMTGPPSKSNHTILLTLLLGWAALRARRLQNL